MISAQSIKTPALVYVRSNGRVSPQVWREPVTDICGYWRERIVAFRPIAWPWTESPLALLADVLPPPAVIGETQ